MVVRGGWGMEGVGVGVAGGGMYSSKAWCKQLPDYDSPAKQTNIYTTQQGIIGVYTLQHKQASILQYCNRIYSTVSSTNAVFSNLNCATFLKNKKRFWIQQLVLIQTFTNQELFIWQHNSCAVTLLVRFIYRVPTWSMQVGWLYENFCGRNCWKHLLYGSYTVEFLLDPCSRLKPYLFRSISGPWCPYLIH